PGHAYLASAHAPSTLDISPLSLHDALPISPRRRLRVALCRRLPSSADHLHGRLGDGPWFGRDNFDAIVHSCSPSRPRHGRAIRYGLTGQCGPAAETRQPPVVSAVLDREVGTDLTPTRVSAVGAEGCRLKTLVNPSSGSLCRQDASSLQLGDDHPRMFCEAVFSRRS